MFVHTCTTGMWALLWLLTLVRHDCELGFDCPHFTTGLWALFLLFTLVQQDCVLCFYCSHLYDRIVSFVLIVHTCATGLWALFWLFRLLQHNCELYFHYLHLYDRIVRFVLNVHTCTTGLWASTNCSACSGMLWRASRSCVFCKLVNSLNFSQTSLIVGYIS